MAEVTRKAWAKRFVNAYDLPVTYHRRIALVTWQSAEGSKAKWNPLATTKIMQGSTNFNRTGVQNYTSMEQGLLATRLTLEQGTGHGYERILNRIKKNAPARDILEAVADSDWGTGDLALRILDDVKDDYSSYADQPIGQ